MSTTAPAGGSADNADKRGVSLQAVVDAPRRLDELSTARVIGSLAEGVHAAQKAGLPVGVLVPDNIRVLPDGSATVGEVGVAAGAVLAYSAPEKLRGQPGDKRSEVFSLGILLWEALTHERLFARASEDATQAAVLDGEIRAPSQINANVPPELDAICKKALARDPGDRYLSARVMATEIESVLEDADYPDNNEQIIKFLSWVFDAAVPTTPVLASSSRATRPATTPPPTGQLGSQTMLGMAPIRDATAVPAGLAILGGAPNRNASPTTQPANARPESPTAPPIATSPSPSPPTTTTRPGATAQPPVSAAAATARPVSPTVQPATSAAAARPAAPTAQPATAQPPTSAAPARPVSSTAQPATAQPPTSAAPARPVSSTAQPATSAAARPVSPTAQPPTAQPPRAQPPTAQPLATPARSGGPTAQPPLGSIARNGAATGAPIGAPIATSEPARPGSPTKTPVRGSPTTPPQVAAAVPPDRPKSASISHDKPVNSARSADPGIAIPATQTAILGSGSRTSEPAKAEAPALGASVVVEPQSHTAIPQPPVLPAGAAPLAPLVTPPSGPHQRPVLPIPFQSRTPSKSVIPPSVANAETVQTPQVAMPPPLPRPIPAPHDADRDDEHEKAAVPERADPSAVVSLPRAATGEILGQWGWSTGSVEALTDDDEGQYDDSKQIQRKRLLFAVFGAVGVVFVIGVLALAFAGGKKHDDEEQVVTTAKKTEPPPATDPVKPVPAVVPAIDADLGAAAADAAVEPPRTEPAITDPAIKTEPPKTEPAKTAEPAVATEPPKAEPPKAEPPKAEPPKAEPPKTEPKIKKPEPATKKPEPATKKPDKKHVGKATTAKPVDPYTADKKPAFDAAGAYKAGLQQFARGDSSAALSTFRTSIASNPGFAPTWRGLGLVYEKLGNKAQARSAFRRYLQLAPNAGDAEQIRDRLDRL